MEHCHLCFVSLPILTTENKKPGYNSSKLQEIISSCDKYLSKDVYLNINWNLPFDMDPFCDECGENTQQLVHLDLKLEQVNCEIKQVISRITEKILNERSNYQLTTHPEGVLVSQHDIFLSNTNEVIIKPVDAQFETYDSGDLPISHDIVYESFQEYPPPPPTPLSQDVKIDVKIADKPNQTSKRRKRNNESSRKQQNKNSNRNTMVIKGAPITSSDLQLQSGSSGFQCPNCNKKFSRLDILKRHVCESQTYECKTCGKSFSSQGSLHLHKRIHTGEKPHKCDTCGKGFTLPHHLRLHVQTHSGEKPYECDICHKNFRDKSYLVKHKVQHSQYENERRKYSCEICSKSFTLYQSLKHHLVRHTGDTLHKCKVCSKAFGTSTKLRKHEITHTDEKQFKCSNCWKTFRSLDGVKNHELIHTGEKHFQCDICGNSFYSVPSLNMHINLKHLDDGDFVCDICGKVYKTKLQLNQHRRHHDRKPRVRSSLSSKCVVCGRSYCDESNLIRHQRVAHVVTTNNSFICQKCGKDFEDFAEYHNHSRVRMSKTSKFRYKCEICETIFPSRCEMISHFSDKHTEAELPFKCSVCGSAFVQRNDLYRHRQQCDIKPEKRKTTQKRVRLKREKCREESASDSDPDNLSSRKSKNNDSSKLRRSGRVRKRNKYFEEQDVSDKSLGSDSEVEHSESEVSPENETQNPVKVKTEDDFWVKQEPDDFSD